MAKQIEAGTPREWLDAQHSVTAVDIRTDEDCAQWAIPGSAHASCRRFDPVNGCVKRRQEDDAILIAAGGVHDDRYTAQQGAAIKDTAPEVT